MQSRRLAMPPFPGRGGWLALLYGIRTKRMSIAHSSSAPTPRLPGRPPGPATPDRELDRALDRLRENARSFARTPATQKLAWLEDIRRRYLEVSESLVRAGCEAKGIDYKSQLAGEEWLGGPAVTMRNLRLLIEALGDVVKRGAPELADSAIHTTESGQLAVDVVPHDAFDRALFAGFTCEARLQPGVNRTRMLERQASFYRQTDPEGKVSLVLGAGNVASIPPMDVLYKMFVEGHVCLLKMNPVNEYLGPFLEQVFQPLTERGYFAVAYGGAEVGSYLCHHPAVDDIHITGSDKTHDAIVWGPPGPERDARKQRRDPLLRKPITSELGNVSPVLITPARYDDDELEFMARNIAGMVTNNASFNCNAAKLLVLPQGWDRRDAFLDKLGQSLARVPARRAYYPGAAERYATLVQGPLEVRRFGASGEPGTLPWTLITGLDATRDHEHFRTEPFCSVLSETAVGSPEPEEFLRAACQFANERVWGTLNCCIFIHPRLEADKVVRSTLERTITDLRYGAVTINHWPAMVYGLASPPWGGHPSATLDNIQSGVGWVHNTLMLEDVEKSVLRGPLKTSPKPVWFPDHRTVLQLAQKLVEFEAGPSWTKIPGIGFTALRA